MQVLVVCVDLPFPPVGGGLIRTYQVLKALSKDYETTVIGFTYDRLYETPSIPVEVISVPWSQPSLYKEMNNYNKVLWEKAYNKLAFELAEPWYVSYFGSLAMKEIIKSVVNEKDFDLILIEDSDMAQYIPIMPVSVPKIVDLHNVYSLMATRKLEGLTGLDKQNAIFELNRTIKFEKLICSQCNLCFTCSQEESAAIKTLLFIEHVAVVPNGVDTSWFKPAETEPVPDSLLFTGTMSYKPNVEAVCWFVKEILPLVFEKIPGVTLHIVGTNPVDEVLALASEKVKILGRVPDMRPYFEKAEIYIAPILSGGGTRLKLLEAAASGKAIVSTSIGAEGIDLKRGEEIILADTAIEFAESVCRLLKNKQNRRKLELKVRQPVLKYDWLIIAEKIRQLAENLACKRT